jgi:nitrite reductase/ring-hydroxylating ferredoxin subunit
LLTDLPIGFWTSAFTLDLLGGRRSRPAATRLVAWGVLCAVPTAVTGASDWSDTVGAERRIGLVHAAANTTALMCYAASWVQRRRGRHWRGVALGLVGATAATVGGYLGGHLLQTLGVGVDRTAFRAPPADWTRVANDGDVTDQPRCFLAGDAPVIVFRHRGRVVALDGQCPHRGAPLAEGDVDGDVLTCPWHASKFHLPDGALLQGPSTVALPAYGCRVVGGAVEVRSAP